MITLKMEWEWDAISNGRASLLYNEFSFHKLKESFCHSGQQSTEQQSNGQTQLPFDIVKLNLHVYVEAQNAIEAPYTQPLLYYCYFPN